jgi:transcriptional regulator with XRE-family HTH domain
MIRDLLTALRTKRIERKFTVREFSTRLGVANSLVGKWETQAVDVPLGRLDAWAAALGCRIESQLIDEAVPRGPDREPLLSPAHIKALAAMREALPQMSEAEASTYCQVFEAIARRDTILAADRAGRFTPR